MYVRREGISYPFTKKKNKIKLYLACHTLPHAKQKPDTQLPFSSFPHLPK